MVFSAPFQNIRLPPPPGFIPPPVPPRPTVISVSVSNPFPAVVTKPSPNYKINTNNNDLQTTTKSILREPGFYSVKNVSDRVVSFDLESSAITTMTKPINHAQGSLAPKCSNPSMPNLHYGCEKVSQKKSKNPFLTGFLTDMDANDSEHESSESQSDDDDFDDFESAENTDLVLSDTTNISHNNNKTVKLGENFFASLFNNTSFTNKIPDPWSATKSTEAKAAAQSANATAWPTMTTASGTPAPGQPQPGPHGLSPMTPANPSATQKSPTGSGVPGSQNRPAESTAASVSVADRYSALKELDEIFKTTVTVSDGEFFCFEIY